MPATARRQLRLPVPVTVVTGALASGKTTAIAALLRSKPRHEVWAVLVNEFGAAGLDAALLEGAGGSSDGVHIQQLAGGCLCCALASVTQLAIAQLLRRVKPDRLVIEPSGLAHPAVLLDMLQGEHLRTSLLLHPVACLVDVTQFAGGAAAPAGCASGLPADQVSVAEVLVGSKADLCGAEALQAFHAWAAQLYPPKLLVATARQGRLDGGAAGLLVGRGGAAGGDAAGQRGADLEPEAGQQQQQAELPVQRLRRGPPAEPWLSSSGEAGGAPGGQQQRTHERREVAEPGGGHVACGWIFDRELRFDRPRLLALLQLLPAWCLRVKGVFRVGQARWEAVSAAAPPPGAAAPAVELREIAYRRDSRVEVILRRQQQQHDDGAPPEQRAAGLSLAGQGAPCPPLQQAVQEAVSAAAAGDWGKLEAQLLAVQTDAPPPHPTRLPQTP